ncbi:MAG: Hydroxypyruvate reductase [Polaribacter sp. SA4-10]|nr:MAG: Hydroxypyruvate reductase [Polaribacter sp. SA4-10]
MKILHLDKNHESLINQLNGLGFENEEDYTSSKGDIMEKIHSYDGLIVRSRIVIDNFFLDKAKRLKFIGRVGAGLENIDCEYAKNKKIELFAAPEGNRNAVGEHSLAMLLSLFNKLNKANREVKAGSWVREENRGIELDGKTIGILGYGNMGKSFSKKLKGFDVDVLCYDLKENVADENCQQVSLAELQERSDVISIHTPQTKLTTNMVNTVFINQFKKSFWLINTARGSAVVTKDLVSGIEKGKILGAGLDVLEYEKSSFENLFLSETPKALRYLIDSDSVILSPHIAGWTQESEKKLADTIVKKIKKTFC